MQGFTQITNFANPVKLTTAMVVAMIAGEATEPQNYRVLLLKKDTAVLTPVDNGTGADGKVIKVKIPFNVVDEALSATVSVFEPEAVVAAEVNGAPAADATNVPADGTAPVNGAPADPAAPVAVVKPESKISKCRAIYAAMPGAAKADVVKRFIDEAGCTKMGANTYYITCSKA